MHQPATYQVNGAALRIRRMNRGVEIAELAQAAGITPSYLSRVEVGTASGRMRPGTYTALRDYLKATDQDLLAPHEDPRERQ
ncbi:helix-turn-helix domain-containing protein [Streptomyces sp. NPDC054933]